MKMARASLKSVFLWLLLTYIMTQERGWVTLASSEYTKQQNLDNDFEDGSIAPWIDQSEAGTRWVLNDISPVSATNNRNIMETIQPPPPLNGKRFLLLKHDLSIFDVGILSTENFVASPGDRVQFSYWISSQYSHFNNIQVIAYVFLRPKLCKMLALLI